MAPLLHEGDKQYNADCARFWRDLFGKHLAGAPLTEEEERLVDSLRRGVGSVGPFPPEPAPGSPEAAEQAARTLRGWGDAESCRHDQENWPRLRQRLEGFRALEPGWDSYDALPITDEALRLAHVLLRAPEVVPSVGGGVQLEWREGKPGGLYVEIEVLPDGMLEVLLMRGDEPAQEWSRETLEPIREAADNWHALMSEAAEHLKEPEHQARVARIEHAIAEEAEERRLLLELEGADREWRTRLSVDSYRLEAARAALDDLRTRQKGASA